MPYSGPEVVECVEFAQDMIQMSGFCGGVNEHYVR
jgi:hypothetical protein